MKTRIAIFISGRGSNMEAIVKEVQGGSLQEHCEIALVFANTSEAAGLAIAKSYGLVTAAIESKGKKRADFDREVLELIEPLQLDYIVLAGYMRILSPHFVQSYRNRIVNIHPADTAAYQGAHGYEWAYENKLKTTKISVHLVDEGVDTGTVLAQRDVDLRGAETLEEFKTRGLTVEHVLFSEVLKKLFAGELSVNE